MPEWLKGTVSKTVISFMDIQGSNPCLSVFLPKCEKAPSRMGGAFSLSKKRKTDTPKGFFWGVSIKD